MVTLISKLRALGALLGERERKALARALPRDLAQGLRDPAQASRNEPASLETFLASPSAQVVCRALGETLIPSVRSRLIQAQPALRALLEPPAAVAPPQRGDDPHGESRTLVACGLLEEREARSSVSPEVGEKRLLSRP